MLIARHHASCGNFKHTVEQHTTQKAMTIKYVAIDEQVGPRPGVTAVRKIAFFMWCDKAEFDFVNYLSLLSLVHYANVQKVIFQYLHLPTVDRFHYNTWFDALRRSVAILKLDNSSLSAAICATENTRRQFMLETIAIRGGVYIGRRTIFIRPLTGLNDPFTNHLLSSYEGYAMSKPDYMISIKYQTANVNAAPACPLSNTLSTDGINSGSVACVYETRTVYPRDFLHNTDLYSIAVRELMYGDNTIRQAVSRRNDLVPKYRPCHVGRG